MVQRYRQAPHSALSEKQQDFLIAKLKITKKTKHAVPFLTPFVPSAEESLTYFDIVKRPMDLGTIETKLESEMYSTVQAFVNDLHLIVDNALNFHGPRHAVTEAASSMLAYIKRALRTVPRYDFRIRFYRTTWRCLLSMWTLTPTALYCFGRAGCAESQCGSRKTALTYPAIWHASRLSEIFVEAVIVWVARILKP